jgi:hypothetical protein
MNNEYEIFKDKTLSSLFEDIYTNSTENKQQLELLIAKVAELIKDKSSAATIVPIIKEYFDITVKNDENLIKLAGIIQKLISAEGKSGSEMEFGISDDEKKRLIEDASNELDKLKKKADSTMKDVEQIIPKDFVDGT